MWPRPRVGGSARGHAWPVAGCRVGGITPRPRELPREMSKPALLMSESSDDLLARLPAGALSRMGSSMGSGRMGAILAEHSFIAE